MSTREPTAVATAPAITAEPDRVEAFTDVCHAVRVAVGMGAAAVTRIVGEELVVLAADDSAGLGLRAGDRRPLERTYCGWALSGRGPTVTSDAAADGYTELTTPSGAVARSHYMVPLEDADGGVFGTLCVLDRRSVELSEQDRRLLVALGAMLSRERDLELARNREQAARQSLAIQAAREADRARLDQIIAALSTEFLRSDDLDATVATALAEVGEFLGADQAGVLYAEESRWRDGPSWAPPGRSGSSQAAPPVTRPLPAPPLRAWHEHLVAGGLAHSGDPWAGAAGEERWQPARIAGARPNGWAVAVPVRGDRGLLAVLVFASAEAAPAGSATADLTVPLLQVGDLVGAAATRHAIAARLRASELRYRTLIDDVTDVVVHLEADGTVSFVNRTWTELTGLTLEETVGAGPMDNVHPEDRPAAMAHMAAVMTGDDSQVPEVRFLTKTGEIRWMEVKGRPVFGPDGTLAGLTGTVHDVTDRRAAEAQTRAAWQEAERAREAAERASQAKSEFLSRMSHELRTPLNAILGFAQLLELAELQPEDADSLRLISAAGQHLLNLINDALDIGRIEAGGMVLEVEPVLLGELARDCLGMVNTDGAAGLAPIDVDGDDTVGVLADPQRLRQVLVNLLSNAVKYNRPGGAVAVRWSTDADRDRVRLAVVDTGPGIPADRIADAFTPFERLGAERSGVEGTGLGLAVVRRLAEAMGGAVEILSVEGEGTTVQVELPLAPPR